MTWVALPDEFKENIIGVRVVPWNGYQWVGVPHPTEDYRIHEKHRVLGQAVQFKGTNNYAIYLYNGSNSTVLIHEICHAYLNTGNETLVKACQKGWRGYE